ncbi:MAG: RHS repeat-associated core domain-containing protein [Saprospiraceae bacterium]|nr:RHS repeat-associated core domain-containing protein [Saprospiraceae bacterium]
MSLIFGITLEIRLTFTDKDNDDIIEVTSNPETNEILQENHYYPFGMNMNGQWMANAGREDKYQYNGKELNEDFGLDWYDYGARWYMPDIGKWNSIDPLAEKFQSWSAYSYAFSNPLRFNDPDGAKPEDIIIRSSNTDSEDARVSYQNQVFQKTKTLTNDELALDRQTGKVTIVKYASEVTKEAGTGLIRDFIDGIQMENGDVINRTVTFTDNANGKYVDPITGEPISLKNNATTVPEIISNAFNGIGSNSIIYYSPDVKSEYFISETEKAISPAFIVAGHELIHAKTIGIGQRVIGEQLPNGHPAKNQEELNTQIKMQYYLQRII